MGQQRTLDPVVLPYASGGSSKTIRPPGPTPLPGNMAYGDIVVDGAGAELHLNPGAVYQFKSLVVQNGGRVVFSGGPSSDASEVYIEDKFEMKDGGILNATGLPEKLRFFAANGAPVTLVDSLSSAYYVCYAPESDIKVDNGAEIYGAVIGRSVELIGNDSVDRAAVHYDLALLGLNLFGTLGGGGGGCFGRHLLRRLGPDPQELTDSAVQTVLENSRQGTSWDETEAVRDISEKGVRSLSQLEILEDTAERARRHEGWDEANEVLDTLLTNPEVTDIHVDATRGVLSYLSEGDNLDESQAAQDILGTLNITDSHNDWVALVTRHASRHPEFTGGNELIEIGLANRGLNRHHLHVLERLLEMDVENPTFSQAEALTAVAGSSRLSKQQEGLLEATIRQAARQSDWTGANQTIDAIVGSNVSDQEARLGGLLLEGGALESQGATAMMTSLLDSPHLEGPQERVVEKLARSLADHDWNPSKALDYLLSQRRVDETRGELAERVLDRLDTDDGFEAVTALLTIFEADEIVDGHQSEAMAAVIERASGSAWQDGNAVLKVLATQPDLTKSEREQVQGVLEAEGLDAFQAVVGIVERTGEARARTLEEVSVFAEAEASLALQGSRAPNAHHLELAQLVSEADLSAYGEGGGSELLDAALANPEFGEHHPQTVRSLLSSPTSEAVHQLALRVAQKEEMSEHQGELLAGVADLHVVISLVNSPQVSERQESLLRLFSKSDLSASEDPSQPGVNATEAARSILRAQDSTDSNSG